MDVSNTLHAYEIDSLLAMKLHNYFAKELDAKATILNITGCSRFESVDMRVAKKSYLVPFL